MEILAETGTVYRDSNKAVDDGHDHPTIAGEVSYTTLQKKGVAIEDLSVRQHRS